MTTLTITSKGQITLKKALLDRIGAAPGDKVEVEPNPSGGLTIKPLPRKTRTWGEIAGMLKRPDHVPPVTIEDMNETIAKGWAGELDDDA